MDAKRSSVAANASGRLLAWYDAHRRTLPWRARAGEAADFYARAFAARDLGRMPAEDEPSKLMHCQIEINGGALMLNVFVSGIGGFVFWIVAARAAEPAVVAQASAMITSILNGFATTASNKSDLCMPMCA